MEFCFLTKGKIQKALWESFQLTVTSLKGKFPFNTQYSTIALKLHFVPNIPLFHNQGKINAPRNLWCEFKLLNLKGVNHVFNRIFLSRI